MRYGYHKDPSYQKHPKESSDYITNPAKTDESCWCPLMAAESKRRTLSLKTLQWAMNKGNNLAHHLIQAFEPGEVEYEKPMLSASSLPMKYLGKV